jgi:hypothetical protein
MCKQTLALIMAVACAAGSLATAEDRAASLLSAIRVEGGQPARVEPIKDGVRVANAAALEADVAAAPDALLCRLAPAACKDVVQLAIGRVASLRCNALFAPSCDEAVRFEARRVEIAWQGDHYHVKAQGPLDVLVEKNFMKQTRGLDYYRPLDKSVSARAPAGWCSWYIFYQDVREDQIVANTRWLAENLKKFGCQYVQIDDGWQGVGRGMGENRDWYVTDKAKFPHGMKWLADAIRAEGFKPGIWLIPYTTSDAKRFHAEPGLFLRRPDGSSAFETRDPKTGKVEIDWCGQYAIDPTVPQGRKWFADLLRMISIDWGYDYVKIDGQGGAPGVYQRFCQRGANAQARPEEIYRATLAIMKSVMGRERILLNCGGQFCSCGYCDAIRIGGDVGPDWQGMQPAIAATMSWLYTNHYCFWTDPDVVCVRPPLTLDQARLWATLVGITGQLLMTSDDMPKLPAERVEIVRRLYPVADIWPMDLYPLPGKPRIFDLRVATPQAGQWDVVAVFNWSSEQTAAVRLDPQDLGWDSGRYVFYDAWEKKLLDGGAGDLTVGLAPMSCKLIAARRAVDYPQLVGTSRHITQGADDLLEAAWNPAERTWSGRSRVVGGDPYELRFTLPPGWTVGHPMVRPDRWPSFTPPPGSAIAGESAKIEGPLAVLTLTSGENMELPWSIAFRQGAAVGPKAALKAVKVALRDFGAVVTWQDDGAVAHRIYRDGTLLGQTAGTSFADHVRRRGVTYHYEIAPVTWAGEGPRIDAGKVTRPPLARRQAKDAWLDEIRPVYQQQDCGTLGLRQTFDANPLRLAGRKYERGLGTHANSEIRYRLDNGYTRLDAEVGVDDEKDGAGTVVFQVFTDGCKVFDSGVMRGKQAARKISVPLDGVEEMALVVTDAGDGITCDHADWADARLIGNR